MGCDHEWRGSPIPRCQRCGRVPHASPSQIETWGRVDPETGRYVGCRRKWKYNRLRHERVPNPAAEFGTRTHAILEDWIREGRWTPQIAASKEGRCLAPGLSYFPVPGQGIAERSVYRPMLGVVWSIKIDSTSEWIPGQSVLVSDLKTTGNLDYVMTPAQLMTNPQRIVYAAEAGLSLNVPEVRARWVYCRRNKPKAVPVEVCERTDQAVERLRVLTNETVRPMIAANVLPLEAFPRDGLVTGECERYGGCPHKHTCLKDLDPVDLLNIRLART